MPIIFKKAVFVPKALALLLLGIWIYIYKELLKSFIGIFLVIQCFLSLLKKLKRALLGLVARLDKVLERLLAEGVLLLADDAALVLHQILTC